MRRRHNAIATALLLGGIIYLCAQKEGSLSDHVFVYEPDKVQNRIDTVHRVQESVRGTPQEVAHSIASPLSSSTAFIGLDDNEQSPVGLDAQKSHSLSQSPQVHQTSSDISQLPESKYAFQDDLELELPVPILQQLSTNTPMHYDGTLPKSYAYATFMATRNPSLQDPYFLAIHSLIYRILWSPRSRTRRSFPFIVFVADFVTQEQRALLSAAGAVVRELKPLEWHCDANGIQERWKDLFAKLNMWAETEFQRILFLDADAFPLANIDDMFDIAPVQNCVEAKLQIDDFFPDRTPVCEPYIFAGVPQDSSNPKNTGVNVGSMLFTPSLRMHQRLVQNYIKTNHYDCAMAEQAFLNWQFDIEGAYPPTNLDRQWGAFFPRDDEEGKLKVVHEKIWAVGGEWLKKEWRRGWDEMLDWYRSAEFVDARKSGRL
jgi:inositol 3-alpha-galactosyltransferase